MFWRYTPVKTGPLEDYLIEDYVMLYPNNATEEHALSVIRQFRKHRKKRIWKELPLIPLYIEDMHGRMELKLRYRYHRRGQVVDGYEIRFDFPGFAIAENQDLYGDKGNNRSLVLETNQRLPDTLATASIGKTITQAVDLPLTLHDIFGSKKIISTSQRGGTNFHFTW